MTQNDGPRVSRWRQGQASAGVVVAVLLGASCASTVVRPASTPGPQSTPPTTVAAPSPPSDAAVVDGRFVEPVQLDDGTLRVEPPRRAQRPTIPEDKAATEIWASLALLGFHAGPLGFGLVTIALHGAGTAAVASVPAWVGFAVASLASCPAEFVSPVPTTTQPVPPSNGYAAIVVGATTGSPAVAYRARTSTCGSPATGPSVASATEAVSIPWVATGPLAAGRLAVRATVPPCGIYRGVSVSGSAAAMTVTLAASVPDVAASCAGPRPLAQTVDLGPPSSPGAPAPLVSSGTRIVHAPLGPIRTVS